MIRQQWLFVGLEGVMVVVAVAVLNAFHPAFCFDAEFEGTGNGKARWLGFFGRRQRDEESKAEETGSGI